MSPYQRARFRYGWDVYNRKNRGLPLPAYRCTPDSHYALPGGEACICGTVQKCFGRGNLSPATVQM